MTESGTREAKEYYSLLLCQLCFQEFAVPPSGGSRGGRDLRVAAAQGGRASVMADIAAAGRSCLCPAGTVTGFFHYFRSADDLRLIAV